MAKSKQLDRKPITVDSNDDLLSGPLLGSDRPKIADKGKPKRNRLPKSYVIYAATVERIAAKAAEMNVQVGDLVDALLNHGCDELDAGKLELEVVKSAPGRIKR